MFIIGQDIIDKFGIPTSIELRRFHNFEDAKEFYKKFRMKYNRVFLYNTENEKQIYNLRFERVV